MSPTNPGSAGLAATSMTKQPAHRTKAWLRAPGGLTFQTIGFVLNAARPRATSTWWSCSTKSRTLAQLQSRRLLKLGDRLRRIGDLDGGHAHLARRLQVDAEIVEIDASVGIDVKRVDHHLIDARIRLP